MVENTGDDTKGVASRYALVMAIAKRAKQIRDGAPKLVDSKSRNPITVAMEEINSGKLKIIIPTAEELEAASRTMTPARQEAVDTSDLFRIGPDEDVLLGDTDSAIADLSIDAEVDDLTVLDTAEEHESEEEADENDGDDDLGIFADDEELLDTTEEQESEEEEETAE